MRGPKSEVGIFLEPARFQSWTLKAAPLPKMSCLPTCKDVQATTLEP